MVSYHVGEKSSSPVFTISDQNFAFVNFDLEVGPVFYRINIVVPCHKTLLHNSSKTLVIWYLIIFIKTSTDVKLK